MTDVVLDASAILAVIFDEPGADVVEDQWAVADVSSVNLAEVATRLLALDMPEDTVEAIIDTLQLSIRPFDGEQAMVTAQLRRPTRSAGLSLGDRACLALAKSRHCVALTADRVWKDIAGRAGVDVKLIR